MIRAWIAIVIAEAMLLSAAYVGACATDTGRVDYTNPNPIVLGTCIAAQIAITYIGSWQRWTAKAVAAALCAGLLVIEVDGLMRLELAQRAAASNRAEIGAERSKRLAEAEAMVADLGSRGAQPRSAVEAHVLAERAKLDQGVDRRTDGCQRPDTIRPDDAYRACRAVREARAALPLADELERARREVADARRGLGDAGGAVALARLPGVSVLWVLVGQVMLLFATSHLAQARARAAPLPPQAPLAIAGFEGMSRVFLAALAQRGGTWGVGAGGTKEIAATLNSLAPGSAYRPRDVNEMVSRLEQSGAIRTQRTRRDRVANSLITMVDG